MGKRIWVLCAVVWMTVGFAGCGERVEDDRAEKVETPEINTAPEDGLMPDSEELYEENNKFAQNRSCILLS